MVDNVTGDKILLCKSLGEGWYFHHSIEKLEQWLDKRDAACSYGNTDNSETTLTLMTENGKQYAEKYLGLSLIHI